jgi:hypothetical protein
MFWGGTDLVDEAGAARHILPAEQTSDAEDSIGITVVSFLNQLRSIREEFESIPIAREETGGSHNRDRVVLDNVRPTLCCKEYPSLTFRSLNALRNEAAAAKARQP